MRRKYVYCIGMQTGTISQTVLRISALVSFNNLRTCGSLMKLFTMMAKAPKETTTAGLQLTPLVLFPNYIFGYNKYFFNPSELWHAVAQQVCLHTHSFNVLLCQIRKLHCNYQELKNAMIERTCTWHTKQTWQFVFFTSSATL